MLQVEVKGEIEGIKISLSIPSRMLLISKIVTPTSIAGTFNSF